MTDITPRKTDLLSDGELCTVVCCLRGEFSQIKGEDRFKPYGRAVRETLEVFLEEAQARSFYQGVDIEA